MKGLGLGGTVCSTAAFVFLGYTQFDTKMNYVAHIKGVSASPFKWCPQQSLYLNYWNKANKTSISCRGWILNIGGICAEYNQTMI